MREVLMYVLVVACLWFDAFVHGDGVLALLVGVFVWQLVHAVLLASHRVDVVSWGGYSVAYRALLAAACGGAAVLVAIDSDAESLLPPAGLVLLGVVQIVAAVRRFRHEPEPGAAWGYSLSAQVLLAIAWFGGAGLVAIDPDGRDPGSTPLAILLAVLVSAGFSVEYRAAVKAGAERFPWGPIGY
ncbi:MAG: hypothetical protein H6825_08330 [Planctomycetes bacterium]|nr:hypothetical protein [Planctomycetota bacterium]